MKKIHKTKSFTILELMVVFSILVILAAFLMPAVTKLIEKAKKTQTKAEMLAIITAIKSYEATYGVLPVPAGWVDASVDSKYDDLMELLTCLKKGAGGPADVYLNTREIRFLDVPTDYTSTDASENGYRDPWGNYYKIYMDTNYDGQIAGPGGTALYGTTFVYSTGKNTGADDYIYSWK